MARVGARGSSPLPAPHAEPSEREWRFGLKVGAISIPVANRPIQVKYVAATQLQGIVIGPGARDARFTSD
jgi:hypothetical protein